MSISKLAAKVIGDKKQWRAYKARTRALPEPYRSAVLAFERYLMHLGPVDGNSMMTMLDDLADLFEQSAVDSTPIRDVVGADPLEFLEAFARNYPEAQWRNREQVRLITAIDRAAGDAEDGAAR